MKRSRVITNLSHVLWCAALALQGCMARPAPAAPPPPPETASEATPPAAQAPGAATPASASAAPAGPGTVPAGSKLLVRLDETLDSARTPAGQSFTATLEADLVGGEGTTVVPMGSTVIGKIVDAQASGRVAGKAELEIAFTEVRVNGRLLPIQSQGVQAVGENTARKSARQVAAGALIGGAINGKKGAGRGAMAGGAVALMTRGNQIQIPAGTLLELQLLAPLVNDAAAPPVGPPTAVAAAPSATESVPAGQAAPGTAAPATAPAASDAKKDCIQKLMGQGFSADEAIKSCER
jgi:hypothetical protein